MLRCLPHFRQGSLNLAPCRHRTGLALAFASIAGASGSVGPKAINTPAGPRTEEVTQSNHARRCQTDRAHVADDFDGDLIVLMELARSWVDLQCRSSHETAPAQYT